MKSFLLFIAAAFMLFSTPVSAGQYVNGYTRSNGTYVQPYVRSSPNGTVTDNYSYQGNVNPNTGSIGTNRYEHDQTSPYYTGPNSQGQTGHANNGYQNPYGQ
jgi:hypothetical protein